MKTDQVIRVYNQRKHHHDPQQEEQQQLGGIPRAACLKKIVIKQDSRKTQVII